MKSKNNVKHFSLDNIAKKQVDDQMKAGNEIESDKDSRLLFDFASESVKYKLPPTGRLTPVVKISEQCKHIKYRRKEVFSSFVFIYFNLLECG